MLTTDHVRSALAKYLTRHLHEAFDLHPLVALLDADIDVLSRQEFRGHVTCGALVINPWNEVLLIHHNALNRWLTPGGHLEPTDTSLFDAALRELREETGLPPRALWALIPNLSTPVQIDGHPIPANPAKGEPAHHHWDFRYLFLLREPQAFELQREEISQVRWASLDEVEPSVAIAVERALLA